MKKLLLSFLLGLFLTAFIQAQVPQKFNYQGVARSSMGAPLVNKFISLRLSILEGSAAGAAVFMETQGVTTNQFGLFSVAVGTGSAIIGSIPSINWASADKYLRVELDPDGGTAYSNLGTSQLLSVPYAMYAMTPGGPQGPAGVPGPAGSANISGTVNKVVKFTAANTGGDSQITDNGTFVGINQTNPFYKLHVTHSGASGIVSESAIGSGSYSLMDVNADNGDAALRLLKAGAMQWNVRNDPASNNFQIYQGGIGERLEIQNTTGNVGINSTAPTYKLQVTHNGSDGILCASTPGSSFSIIDISADNGDASLRLQRAGVTQWNIRNDPANDNLQFYEYGSGERMQIQNTTGNVGIGITPTAKLHVGGNFTATGVKAFTIDHPLDPENKVLRHFSIESPDVLNLYSGIITTDGSGHATVNLPDYFASINKDFRYQLTVIGSFSQAIISREISGNEFEIATSQPNVKVSWEVTGIRNDGYMKNVNTMQAEEMKPENLRGKYYEPRAFNLPETMGVNYSSDHKTSKSSLEDKPSQTLKPARPAAATGSVAR